MQMLEAEGLVSGYGDMNIIRGIDLKLERGEVMMVLGLNGSGKTTLLRTIAGFLDVKKGRLAFEGSDIGRFDVRSRSKLGITLITEFGVFPAMSVSENLEIATYKVSKGTAKEAAKKALDLFPEIQPMANLKAASLSGGQRKMLSMAMAMASESKLLMLDEPSAGLSPILVRRISDYLELLKETGATMLIAEQNPAFVRKANQVLIMESGETVFSGTPDEALKLDNIRQRVFAL